MAQPKMTFSPVLVLVLVLILNPVNAAITCNQAAEKLFPCVPFLTGFGPAVPSDQCCAGAQELDKIAAASKPDLIALCECLKQAASQFPINYDRANELTKDCKLSLQLKISPDLDCSKL